MLVIKVWGGGREGVMGVGWGCCLKGINFSYVRIIILIIISVVSDDVYVNN